MELFSHWFCGSDFVPFRAAKRGIFGSLLLTRFASPILTVAPSLAPLSALDWHHFRHFIGTTFGMAPLLAIYVSFQGFQCISCSDVKITGAKSGATKVPKLVLKLVPKLVPKKCQRSAKTGATQVPGTTFGTSSGT